MLFRGVATTSTILVGRRLAAHQPGEVGPTLWKIVGVCGWVALTTPLLPLLFHALVPAVLPGGAPDVVHLTLSYLAIRAFEAPFLMFSVVVWSYLAVIGDTRGPLAMAWISVAVNIVLDHVFMNGAFGLPAMGVQGVALASLVAASSLSRATAPHIISGRRPE
jgi:Na+-driven multidrug efflux pump